MGEKGGANMTQSILMYDRQYHDHTGQSYHLEYYLLIDRVIFGCNSLEVYGIRIRHYAGEELLSQRAIRGITPFGPRIVTFINRLSDALTPPEVMGRMIPGGDEWVSP